QPPPRFFIFPYTTLFRSRPVDVCVSKPSQPLAVAASVLPKSRVAHRERPQHLKSRGSSRQLLRCSAVHGPSSLSASSSLYRTRLDRKSTRLNSSHVKISY